MTHRDETGRKTTSVTDKKIQQARQMVLANRRVIIDEVASSLQIRRGSAYQLIQREFNRSLVAL